MSVASWSCFLAFRLGRVVNFGLASRLACVFEHRSGAACCGREHRREENARQMAATLASNVVNGFCTDVAFMPAA
jgi:hypothetical protein